ncbi:hypothetical protein AMTRI_Chr03g56500 [Amborella trichopoda]
MQRCKQMIFRPDWISQFELESGEPVWPCRSGLSLGTGWFSTKVLDQGTVLANVWNGPIHQSRFLLLGMVWWLKSSFFFGEGVGGRERERATLAIFALSAPPPLSTPKNHHFLGKDPASLGDNSGHQSAMFQASSNFIAPYFRLFVYL